MKLVKGLYQFAAALTVAVSLVGTAHAQTRSNTSTQTPLYWPNEVSKANSDDWLRKNHDRIFQLRPKLLVINFANGMVKDKAYEKLDQLILALREASKYHGFARVDASPQLEYQLFKYVDVTDANPLPDDQILDGNSSLYPRVPNWKEGINFKYSELFTDRFAELLGVEDPDSAGHFLNLKQMVERGVINEVWFFARQGKYGAPFECTEVKQAYDSSFNKIAGKSVQAGNGGTDQQPFLGRSLRILFINAERGPGCAMESLGHAVEGTSNSGAIPYFTRYFAEYAGFDLKQRFGLPFNSLYARNGAKLNYPEQDQISYVFNGKAGKYLNYYVVGGNVHFAPNAREDYDLSNTQPVLSSIEHFRLKDGQDEKDQRVPWTTESLTPFKEVAPDCQGPWVVYWRQNFPGYGSACLDDSRKPMKSWWPFLFY